MKIYKELDEINLKTKNLKLDIQALGNRIKSMDVKIRNADLYIKEIDSHEKSIFEFWKFANKDENLLLNSGQIEEIESKKKIETVYDYKEDIEEIGIQIDKLQRNSLTKIDTDCVYITTNLVQVLNKIDEKDVIETSLKRLKQEAEEERILFNTDKLDIFGSVSEDSTKIKNLGNKKHREVLKNKLQILDINKDTDIEEYKKKLQDILNNVNDILEKSKSGINIPIYAVSEKEEILGGLQIFDINPEEVIRKMQKDDIYLYRINIRENDKIIYFTNSIYYDNYNKTLPFGMNVSTGCLINLKNEKLNKIKIDKFKISEQLDEFKISVKTIHLFEYELLEEDKK